MGRSAKERMQKYRTNMSDDKRCLILSKNATQQKRSRAKWDDKKKQQDNANWCQTSHAENESPEKGSSN